jgi:hypothetical protein
MRAIVSSLLVLAFAAAALPARAQDVPPVGPGPLGQAPVVLGPQDPPPPAGQPPAQPVPKSVQPAPTPRPAQPGTPVPMPVPPPAGEPVVPKRRTNVQVEVTITDQVGTKTPEKKTVSMIAADSTWGRIRAGADAQPTLRGPVLTRINVDARPVLLPNSQNEIQLELTIEYQPLRLPGDGSQEASPTNLNQSMTLVLTSGKPLQISQAADPITDRKILCEVKATILK